MGVWDIVEEALGEESPGPATTKQFTLRLPIHYGRSLDTMCSALNMSVSEVLRRICCDGIEALGEAMIESNKFFRRQDPGDGPHSASFEMPIDSAYFIDMEEGYSRVTPIPASLREIIPSDVTPETVPPKTKKRFRRKRKAK